MGRGTLVGNTRHARVESCYRRRVAGYARVSTEGQDLDSLSGQLKAAGCERLFLEKITGEHANRPQLKKLLRLATRGDVGKNSRRRPPLADAGRKSFASRCNDQR